MSAESVESDLENLDIKYYDFKQFEVLETIGVGTFATVHKAKLIDSGLDTEYIALKLTLLIIQPIQIKLQMKMGIDDQIIQVYGLSKTQVAKFDSKLSYVLVLEFADSGTLRHYLQENQNLSWFDKLHLAQQLAEAIMHMHSAGVIHRDL
ncbi:10394_t:CDS:2, partial [Racocetra persica]